MKNALPGLVLLTFASVTASSATLTIGAPGDPFNGDCAPFGCALEYQQVYGSILFPGAISITGLTFFNTNFVPGSIAAANYTVSLSTTAAVVNGLSTTFADNVGADSQVFFSGMLGGPIGPANQFTLTGTPFTYDPAAGNLLLSVTSDGTGQEYSVFLDILTNAPAGTFSRAYSFDASGIASALEINAGLVTEFTYDQRISAIPEPTSFWFCILAAIVLRKYLVLRGQL